MIEFEWDEAKAKSNASKHGVTFEEAVRVFDDPYAFFRDDRSGSSEARWQAVGIAFGVTVLLVVHTVNSSAGGQSETIRIISARAATRREQALYDQNRAQDIG
jgi:hypothetical protein